MHAFWFVPSIAGRSWVENSVTSPSPLALSPPSLILHTSPNRRMFKFWKWSSHLLTSSPITMVTGPRVVSVETEAEQ